MVRDVTKRVVLIVDDDRTLVEMLVESLRREPDFDPIGTTGGWQIVGLLPRVRPAVVLFDLNMPEMDGIELLEWLRHEPTTRDVPLIGMTGLGRFAGMRREALGAGCRAVIDKPFDLDDLLATLRASIADVTAARASAAES